MWQRAVKPYVESGRLIAIGVVQEQHPDRTRLYRQWRQLDWPIFVDSMNLIDHVTVVPIPMALDEAGRVVNPRMKPQQLDAFMETPPAAAAWPENYNRAPAPNFDQLRELAGRAETANAWRTLGAAYFNFGAEQDLDRAVDALERALKAGPANGQAHFALGAALRRRYETPLRRAQDAQQAVLHWGSALEANPNHYIWRRRLQQYGPRLDKPYNFYYWVEEARKDIRARGEKPAALAAEPMGSELAPPSGETPGAESTPRKNPDPEGRVHRDLKGLVGIETFSTPGRVRPGNRVRARINLRLNEQARPWWNNEADGLRVWVDLPEGLTMIEQRLSLSNPAAPETRELRQLEFEAVFTKDAPEGALEIPAYALYYVCEDAGGACYYLRQDFKIGLHVDPDAPALR